MTDDCCGSAQPTVGTATPKQVVLMYVKKQTEQAIGNKPAMGVPPVPASTPAWMPALAWLSDGLWMGCGRQIHSFLPELLFGHGVYHSKRKQISPHHQFWKLFTSWTRGSVFWLLVYMRKYCDCFYNMLRLSLKEIKKNQNWTREMSLSFSPKALPWVPACWPSQSASHEHCIVLLVFVGIWTLKEDIPSGKLAVLFSVVLHSCTESPANFYVKVRSFCEQKTS